MRLTRFIAFVTLLAPVFLYGASREQQEMQRDIAQLQDQVRMLQSGFDQKMAAVETLIQQALDAGNKANTSVNVLNSSVTQTLDRELKDALRPVAGLTAKVDNANNDISEVKSSMADITNQLNRIQQLLADMNNAIKVIQAPPAAPPPSNTNPDSPATRNAPPPASLLWGNARGDYNSGKADLALSDFAEFLKDYPDDPNAPEAQFTIGEIHLGQLKYDLAVGDFDAVLERYPDGKVTPDAYFMKGMALKQSGHRDAAVTEWRALRKKYPKSDAADRAAEQLRAMGLSPGASTATSRKK